MKYLLLFLLNLIFVSSIAQQRAMLTQSMFNGLTINPAYSAIPNDFIITAIGRQQWSGFDGGPNSQYLALHTPINQSNTSVGLTLMRDHIGEVITETGSYLSFAQRVKIHDKTYLAAGMTAGVSKYAADYNQLWDLISSSDPTFQNESVLRADFGFGIMLFSDNFYAGLSSPFLLSTNISSKYSNNNKAHYMLQGGYLRPMGDYFKLKGNVLFKYVDGAPLQMDLSTNLLVYETVWVGGVWRSFDSFDGILQLYLSRSLQVGYSYDFTTTNLRPAQKGSHELMIKFTFPNYRDPHPCYFF